MRDSNKLLVSSIRRFVRADRVAQLRKVVRKSHPADLAHIFGSLTPEQRRAVLEGMEDRRRSAELLAELEPTLLGDVIDDLEDEELSVLLSTMHSDDLADVLQWIQPERKERLLSSMSLEEQSETESLMGHDPESAGGLMSTDYISLGQEMTAGEALRVVQDESEAAEIIFYVYVVNEHDHLVGVTSIREIVRRPKSLPLKDFMITEVIRVGVETDQEEVARLVARYNLLALPVVEANNRLAGIVTVDDIIDVIRHEATEDIFKMAGVGEGEVNPSRSPWTSFRSRVPWLLPSFAAGAAGVLVVSHYEARLLALIPLAALIPMFMGMAGSVGTQSSTLVTRWLAVGKLEFAQIGKVVATELLVGLGTGLCYGALICLFVWAFFAGHPALPEDSLRFGVATGVALCVAMGFASTLGAASPILFDRLGLDPATARGPFVTTTIDVLAIWLYLAAAAFIM